MKNHDNEMEQKEIINHEKSQLEHATENEIYRKRIKSIQTHK